MDYLLFNMFMHKFTPVYQMLDIKHYERFLLDYITQSFV